MAQFTQFGLKKLFKKLGYTILISALLAAGIHLFLYYRAGVLLKGLVERLSEGSYTANAQKLRIGYFPLSVKAAKISMFPLDTLGLERRYYVYADSLQLSLSSVRPLIFSRILEVKKVRIVNPRVLVSADGRIGDSGQTKFNVPIQEIQEGLLAGLAQFQVDQCEIVNGSFESERTDLNNRFYINNVDISIDSLLAARQGNLRQGSDTLMGHLTLRLSKPEIIIPDSTIRVDIDSLYVNTLNNQFKIRELRFSRSKEEGETDTLQLSSIGLRGLNWQRFLYEGWVELDSVVAGNGLAILDLTDRILFEKRDKLKKDEPITVEVPFTLHYVEINQVYYQLTSRNKGGPFTIRLNGDSLMVKDFIMKDTTKRPISVGSVSVNIRNYHDSDEKKTYRSTFDRLSIDNDNLLLNNYTLVPLNRAQFGDNNELFIPSLLLQSFDLGELLQARLEASRLILNQPRLTIDLLERKNRSKSADASGLYTLFRNLQPSLDIGQLEINDATILLQPRSDIANSIEISQISTTIDVEQLLAARSIKDLMQVSAEITTDGFNIRGPRFNFRVQDAKIHEGAELWEMKRLQGSMAQGIDIDFADVMVRSYPQQLPIPIDGVVSLAKVVVGDGQIIIGSRLASEPKGAPKIAGPAVIIDSLATGWLKVLYKRPDGDISIEKVELGVSDLSVGEGPLGWRNAVINGYGVKTGTGKYLFDVARLSATLPGFIDASDVNIKPANAADTSFRVKVPWLKLQTPLQSVDLTRAVWDELWMHKPEITLNIQKDSVEAGDTSTMSTGSFALNRLVLDQPEIKGRIFGDIGSRAFSSTGGRIRVNGLEINGENTAGIKIDQIDATVPGLVLQIDSSWTIRPGRVRMLAHALQAAKGNPLQGMIDTLLVEGVGNLPVKANIADLVGLGYLGVANLAFPISKDSLLPRLIRQADWWGGNIFYSLAGGKQDFTIYNARADNKTRTIAFDSLILKPKITREAFWESQPFEKDYIELSVGPTILEGVDHRTAGRPALFVRHLSTTDLKMVAERDKNRPHDTVSYRPMLAAKFSDLPFDLHIDTLQLSESSIRYNEIGDKFGKEGSIWFTNIEGHIYDILNTDLQETDSLTVHLFARMMGETPVEIIFRQSYTDTLQGFVMQVRVSDWNMKNINPLIAPLFSAELLRGVADSVWLRVTGNDFMATGMMGMQYSKLRVGLLKDAEERKYFLAGLLNFGVNLIVRSNSFKDDRLVYAERLRNKSIFNFWVRIILGGASNNVGVPGANRKARKGIRQAQKF